MTPQEVSQAEKQQKMRETQRENMNDSFFTDSSLNPNVFEAGEGGRNTDEFSSNILHPFFSRKGVRGDEKIFSCFSLFFSTNRADCL